MKMAMKDGQILIREADNVQFTIIKSWGKMKWSRQTQTLSGPADIELLNRLAGLVNLPPSIEAERKKLNEVMAAVDRERMNPKPEPLIPPPVKESNSRPIGPATPNARATRPSKPSAISDSITQIAAPKVLPVADNVMPITPNAKLELVNKFGITDLFMTKPPDNRIPTSNMLTFFNANLYIFIHVNFST